MAVSALRLRRKVLSLSTFIFNHHRTPLCSSSPTLITHSSSQNPRLDFPNFPSQSRAFRSSNVSFARPRTSYNDDDKPIMENDILFEGCDYNHWLIVMDFPKDNKPSPEQMVETYVQTAAKVLGSVEEAKRKIYACSTTTYQGFQVEVSEEVSNKFEGLPGVVFVLPDSYIDPANKEYGGDKYINGTIIPRPPPVQYNRPGGRYGDRNREFRENRERGGYQQRSQTYDNQGSMQGSPRNFTAPQNPPPQQNYGAPRVNEISVSIPENNFSGDQVPPYHGNYNQERGGNSYPQGRDVPPGQLNNNTTPRVAVSYQGAGMNYGQAAGGDQRHGVGGSHVQGAGGGYGQGGGGGYGQGAGEGYGQGAGGGYGQGADGGYGEGGGYRQGASGGGYRQGAAGRGNGAAGEGYQQGAPGGGYGSPTGGYGVPSGGYGQGTGGGVPGHDKFSNYGQSFSVHGGNERSQGEQMNDVRQVSNRTPEIHGNQDQMSEHQGRRH